MVLFFSLNAESKVCSDVEALQLSKLLNSMLFASNELGISTHEIVKEARKSNWTFKQFDEAYTKMSNSRMIETINPLRQKVEAFKGSHSGCAEKLKNFELNK